jgi:hypothetical protein
MKCKNWLLAPTCGVSPPRCGILHSGRLLFSLLTWTFALIGCGGRMEPPPPPPAPDFSISVSPSSVSIGLGGITTPVTVTVIAKNGFTGSVDIQLQGTPPGVASLPSISFSLTADASQAVSFSVSDSATPATSSITVLATSGSLSHNGNIGLTLLPMPIINTFETATMVFLETDTPTETTRVGLLKAWGGSITEVSLNGTNYVNSDDPGRQIQTSLWDGNANYSTSWGYNPIEAGDHDFQGSPLLAFTVQPDSLYTKTQPIQWAPENFGGGPGSPVLGDAYIEKWITVVPGYNRVFKIHYKITHFGTDSHAQNGQELPVAYVNPNISHFLYYGGNAPWTNGALTPFNVEGPCCSHVRTPEQWGAYVDDTNIGLALYTPGQFPQSQVFNAVVTLQLTPLCPFSWGPGTVLEFDTYILAGHVDQSRAAIYALHSQRSEPSPLPPWGALDSPSNGDTLRGNTAVSGWAWGLSEVASIVVLLDDSQVASATLGISRPDVTSVFPDAPTNTGFQASVDTTKFPNGIHSMVVKATNVNGAISIFPTVLVTIGN